MEHAILGGELWTDERGGAVVVLPAYLHGRELEYEYELHAGPAADATAELADGRLSIASAAPHVKVAWRLVYRATATSGAERRRD